MTNEEIEVLIDEKLSNVVDNYCADIDKEQRRLALIGAKAVRDKMQDIAKKALG